MIKITNIVCISLLLLMKVAGMASAQQKYPQINIQEAMTPRLPEHDRDTLTICILGDMMMHEAQIANALRADGSYDFSTYFMHIAEDIRTADIAIANMEFTLAGTPYSGYPCFSAPDSFAIYLKECGFDVFLTANNHIYDKGTEGAQRTLETYRKLGVSYTGMACDSGSHEATTPLEIDRKGISIAIINTTYGTNQGIASYWPRVNYLNSRQIIETALDKAEHCDFTIVFPHWGEEYILTHSQEQERTAAWLAGKGADMIIGAHPHVIQDTGNIDGVPVIYSLGNAVSNMSAANTQLELMVKVRMAREGMRIKEMLPPEFTYLWCSRPGGYCSSYTVLPVAGFIGTREKWQGPWEYDKMMATYERVRRITGIVE